VSVDQRSVDRAFERTIARRDDVTRRIAHREVARTNDGQIVVAARSAKSTALRRSLRIDACAEWRQRAAGRQLAESIARSVSEILRRDFEARPSRDHRAARPIQCVHAATIAAKYERDVSRPSPALASRQTTDQCTTLPASTKPPPKPMSNSLLPGRTRPSRTAGVSASGMLAPDVLPYSSMLSSVRSIGNGKR